MEKVYSRPSISYGSKAWGGFGSKKVPAFEDEIDEDTACKACGGPSIAGWLWCSHTCREVTAGGVLPSDGLQEFKATEASPSRLMSEQDICNIGSMIEIAGSTAGFRAVEKYETKRRPTDADLESRYN